MATAEVTCPAGTVVGTVEGTTDGDVRRFHSIPYSTIPSPFADATPASRGMLIDASTPRPGACALTVTTPGDARDGDDMPVLVWIHGGRFEEGSHTDDAGAYAFAAQGIIHVSIDYRMKLPGLVQFSDDGASHFRASHDCQLALEWVQHNIEAFGGDPTNVTLVGQSAGANLVVWLARRDHYRGGFRRAVALSPAFPRRTVAERKASLRASLSMPLTRSALDAAPAERLERGYRRFRAWHFSDLALGPGPLEPAELAAVDLVVTSTRDEFYPLGARVDAAGTSAAAIRASGWTMGLDPRAAGDYIAACRGIDPDHLMGRFLSDSLIRRFVDRICEGAPGRVWQAEFVSGDNTAATHCCELPALFAQGRYGAGEGLNGWLARFCATGDPGWPAYDEGRAALRVTLPGAGSEVVADPLGYLRGAFRF
ncbi:carboxylesterase family protein [Corynebacterium liangguodongii]|uniref:Carboxylic ester hydrolase n=1 Tax=Corynebacterium liangguodongii TaxID=2079535 RepID=A0A2S0WFA9_9CORY|nr:carboxylesterase family protein [Corynebacterium liangguodongii]AWB84473.1 carboxylesterase [Corynebacterium liangguodongii]PWB98596.1 carboxylesterase/lipase family protein [Corynebacterium liangguodongii]